MDECGVFDNECNLQGLLNRLEAESFTLATLGFTDSTVVAEETRLATKTLSSASLKIHHTEKCLTEME
jgi:hypothetical protein